MNTNKDNTSNPEPQRLPESVYKSLVEEGYQPASVIVFDSRGPTSLLFADPPSTIDQGNVNLATLNGNSVIAHQGKENEECYLLICIWGTCFKVRWPCPLETT